MLVPLGLTLLLAAVYLLTAPDSPDHAAQAFRTDLFRFSGATIWDNYWFGGHYLPTYSLLAPPISAWIGFRAMGVISVLGTVLFFGLATRREWGEAARFGQVWFVFSAATSLFAGRLTFALGTMIAAAAIYFAQTGRRAVSLVLAAATGPASPVAALFLACLGFSHSLSCRLAGRRDLRGLQLAAVAFTVSVTVAFLFPGSGDQPYVWSSFLPALALTLASAFFVPRDQRLILTGILVYAVALTATFLIPTPMGGNANRLGTLLLGPMLAIGLAGGGKRPGLLRGAALTLLCGLIVWWQVAPVVRDLSRSDSPAARAYFYEPLERALVPRLADTPARVEVVPGATHWESAMTAPAFPLARGWERQTDRSLNPIFYRERLPARLYRRWLDRLAVAWVALPETPLDFGSETEATLIRHGVGYLHEVPVAGPWRLFRVADPAPMAERPARMTALSTSGFTLTAPRPGTFKVRIRQSPYFRVVAGHGCVEPDGDWTRAVFPTPGRIRVESRFSPAARFSHGRQCRP